MQLTYPRNPRSEEEARRVIEDFFPPFNQRDVKGLLRVMNFPHLRFTASRTILIPSGNGWTGFPPLEAHWHHSALDSLTFVQSDANKVHALVVFSRFRADGQQYGSYSALWIVTKADEHWGIQVSSTLAL